jgi:hypothetical protein
MLPNAPSISFGTPGNLIALQPVKPGSTTQAVCDASQNCLSVRIQFHVWGVAAVSSTNGCLIQFYQGGDTTPTWDTVPVASAILTLVPPADMQAVIQSVDLPTGKYLVTMQNLDAANSIQVAATSSLLA